MPRPRYALLVVMRWREERDAGACNEVAVERAMEHAGRSVVFSGTTVAIALLTLVVLPVPFLRSSLLLTYAVCLRSKLTA